MVNLRCIVLVAVLVVCSCSALEQPANTKNVGTRTFALMSSLPQKVHELGAALNPINAINAALSYLPALPNLPAMPALPSLPSLSDILPARPGPDGTVTKTQVIKVTKTMTRHPVCMTSLHGSHPPPCSKLAKPHNTHHVNNHDAVYAGNGLGVVGSVVNDPSSPQQAFAAIVPSPHHEVHDDDYDWNFRGLDPESAETEEAIIIEPTVVARIPEASATVESARQSRNLHELEASVEELAAEGDVESKRPHPRYLITKKLKNRKPAPPTITKQHYVTVTEKLFDSHYTATLVAQNCVPGHIPICPTKHYQVKPTAAHYPTHKPQYEAHKPQYEAHKPQYEAHKPQYEAHKPQHEVYKPHYETHKPQNNAHKPVNHYVKPEYNKPVQHKPVHRPQVHKPVQYPVVQSIQFPVNQKPIIKPVWHAKDAVDKIDKHEVENDADAIVDAATDA